MALPEHDHIPFVAESRSRPTSAAPGPTQHNQPRDPAGGGILPCLFDPGCLCSFASDHPPSSKHPKLASFVSSGCSQLAAATQMIGDTMIPNTGTPPAPSITPLYTSRTSSSPSGSSSSLPAKPVLSSPQGTALHYSATGVLTAYSTLTAVASPPSPSSPPEGPSSPSPPPSNSHQLNTGTIIAIVLSALAVVLASALAFFFFCCRARARARRSSRRSKRTSAASSQRRLGIEPHAYDGASRCLLIRISYIHPRRTSC